MKLMVDSLETKRVISLLHPDPVVRTLAHLNLATRNPQSFTVPVTKELPTLLSLGKQLVRDRDPTMDLGISCNILQKQVSLLPGKPSPVNVITPLKGTVEYLLAVQL